MRKGDIRFSGKAATINHHSARGKVIRNSGAFTRGSQLLTHEVLMTWAGIKLPLFIMLFCWLLLTSLFLTFFLVEHEIQLVLMRAYAWAWDMVDLSPDKRINLTLPDGSIVNGPMLAVPYHPAVAAAVDQALRCILAGGVGSAFLTVPLTIWFVNISRRRGLDILKERHERGAMQEHEQQIARITSRPSAMTTTGGRGPHAGSSLVSATLWNQPNPGHSTLFDTASKPSWANQAAIASRTPNAFITRSSVSSVGLPLSLNAR